MYGTERSTIVRKLTSPKLSDTHSIQMPIDTIEAGSTDTINASMYKLDLGIPKISDFISKLQEQIQRFNPSFAFKYCPESPLLQAIKLFSQAIDNFLERYSKLIANAQSKIKGEPDIDEENYSARSDSKINRSQNLDNAKETMKNLCKYELLLKKKEENLREEKEKFNEELENLKIIDENISQTKIAIENDKIA